MTSISEKMPLWLPTSTIELNLGSKQSIAGPGEKGMWCSALHVLRTSKTFTSASICSWPVRTVVRPQVTRRSFLTSMAVMPPL